MKKENEVIKCEDEKDMRVGWNARAEEDPLYYILSDPKYRDIRQFNQGGIETAAYIMRLCGPFLIERDAVLDIGCGIGRVLKYMRDCFNWGVGVDVSSKMIELAHKHIDNSVELRVIDGYTMSELQDNYFNLAYAVLLFEHFPNKDVGLSLINETYRVLTPGGIFCLFIATTEKGTTEGTSWGGVHWTEPEIVLAFTDAGFQIVKTTADPHPNPLITSRVIIGRK